MEQLTLDLYDRQKTLNMEVPSEVLIIGVGGTGSWMALNMALIGVKKLYIVDYDNIENTNLNRTLFKNTQIGTFKTNSIYDLIMDRREDITVKTFNKKFEKLSRMELNQIKNAVIIDCRDKLVELPEILKDNILIRIGYDGFNITVILNPIINNYWSTGLSGYSVIPSCLMPCEFLSSVITTILTDPGIDLKTIKNKITTFDLRSMIRDLFVPSEPEPKELMNNSIVELNNLSVVI